VRRADERHERATRGFPLRQGCGHGEGGGREAAIEEKDAIINVKDAVIQEKDAAVSGYATSVSELRASVAALTALLQVQQYELVTVRGSAPPSSRQYVIPLGSAPPPPPPPPPLRFDAEWYARSMAGTKFLCDLNAPHYDRVRCTAQDDPADAHRVWSRLVLRAAAPLPRPPRLVDADPVASAREETPAACTFIIVKYPPKDGGVFDCPIGLLPSTAVATPTWAVIHLRGYTIYPHSNGTHPPTGPWTAVTDSEFVKSMQVPEGGAVRFSLDYAASTCRLTFYTPAAVAMYPAVNVCREGVEVRLL
jgi:hypothetical protein